MDKNLFSRLDRSPLHLAASEGHLEVCKLILQQVQDKNPMAHDAVTPLHSAAGIGQVEARIEVFEKSSCLKS